MLRRRDPTGIRAQRMQRMHDMLKGGHDVDLDMFIANIEYQMGLTGPTIMRYLRVLEKLGFIEINEVENKVREVKTVE